jgi:hypothetical protein
MNRRPKRELGEQTLWVNGWLGHWADNALRGARFRSATLLTLSAIQQQELGGASYGRMPRKNPVFSILKQGS